MIKKLILSLLLFLVLVISFALIVLIIDNYNTQYLDIDNNKSLSKNSYVIIHANVVPMDKDTVLRNKVVLVENGIIQSISDSITRSDLPVIDADYKYLSPGLIDMHVHVWDKYELGLYLANGVTAVRNLWGLPMHLRIKEEIRNNQIIAPVFFTTSPKLTGPEFIGDDNINLTSVEEVKEKVISYKSRGYDFIKTYYGLTEDLFDAILQQSEISEMDIVSHPTPKVPYTYHFNPQIKTIEHAEDIVQQPLNYQLDTAKLNEVIQGYVSNPHATLSPTLIVYYNIYNMLMDDNILSSDRLNFINPLIRMVDSQKQFDRWNGTKADDSTIVSRIKDQHDFHLLIIKKLHDSGVTIVCGTDSGIGITTAGYSIHQELDFYKQAGMSNYEVMKTATISASQVHDIMSNMGSIESGKTANLILTDQNPLEDLSTLQNPQMVMVKGRKLEVEDLKLFENKAKGRSNLIASALRYAENLMVE
ncbi:MAG: amidohydrolase family protein [Reichenbachiella sp.]